MYADEGHAGLGVDADELVEDAVHKAVWAGQGRVHDVVVERLCGGVARRVAVVDEAVGVVAVAVAALHGLDGGAGVAGALDFGDDVDAESVGAANEFDEVLASPVAVGRAGLRVGVAVAGEHLVEMVVLAVGTITAACAHLCQLGQTLDFQAPGLVVGDVEVETVEAVDGHDVQDFVHRLGAEEVTRDVDVLAAPGVVGPVGDDGVGKFFALVGVKHLAFEMIVDGPLLVGAAGDDEAVVAHGDLRVLGILGADVHEGGNGRDGALAAGELHALEGRDNVVRAGLPVGCALLVLGIDGRAVFHEVLAVDVPQRGAVEGTAHIVDGLGGAVGIDAVDAVGGIAAVDDLAARLDLEGDLVLPVEPRRGDVVVAGHELHECVAGIGHLHVAGEHVEAQARESGVAGDGEALDVLALALRVAGVAHRLPGDGCGAVVAGYGGHAHERRGQHTY